MKNLMNDIEFAKAQEVARTAVELQSELAWHEAMEALKIAYGY